MGVTPDVQPDLEWCGNLAHSPRVTDLGSQLEDLMTHVLRCERWARFDDRLDLAWTVERKSRRGQGGG